MQEYEHHKEPWRGLHQALNELERALSSKKNDMPAKDYEEIIKKIDILHKELTQILRLIDGVFDDSHQ